jgi:hypothetical protein
MIVLSAETCTNHQMVGYVEKVSARRKSSARTTAIDAVKESDRESSNDVVLYEDHL